MRAEPKQLPPEALGPAVKAITDEELMLRFCDGDEAAFDLLFERHAGPLQGFLGRTIGEPEQVRDLLQVTFLSMVRSRLRYQRGAAVAPWLFTIAANAARDALRHAKRVKGHRECGHGGEAGHVEPTVGDPTLRRRLMTALDALPTDQRAAVMLHKVEGWSFREIARSAGITETAARIRAHRGCEKLRTLLGDQRA